MKYHIVTYGCQMNVHESEKIAGILEKLGYTPCDKREEADIIVFNTCAIREGAEDRVLGNVGNLKRLKKQNKDLIIVVCGCMTQKEKTARVLMQKFPFVDIVIGTFNLPKLADYIEVVKKGRQLVLMEEGEIDELEPYKRTSGDNAWVNIMQGCNNFCTYCIVPYVRGREKSRKEENILNEICALDGDFTLTFMTSHPKDLTSDVIDQIARQDKIEKSIHLPAQSGNNRILKLMNRRYTREKYLAIIDEIRQKIPNCRITSDFIVGFPTETEEEFEDTCSLVKQVKFDSIFAFMYSKRDGTVASRMDGQISEEEKNRRVNILLKIEKDLQKEKK